VDELLRACLAVGSALHALRAGMPAPALTAKLDQAGAAVRDVPASPFAAALRRVLEEIDRCRRADEHSSPRLDSAVRLVVETLTR
jgi:hypothetical protein